MASRWWWLSLVVLAVASEALETSGDLFTCPDEWELRVFHCYRFFGIRHSWKTAAEICKRYGSELLIVEENAQSNFTSYLAKEEAAETSDKTFWIGLYAVDNLNTNTLESSSGDYVSKYSGFWAPHQPEEKSGDCVESRLSGTSQSWQLTTCEKLLPFMCRFPACPKGSFHCANGKCINNKFRCDGDDDCGDFSDETACPKLCHIYQKGAGDSLESPGFPKKYEPNLDCKWTLEGPIGSQIVLQFSDFSTEENFDTVQILAGGKTEESSVAMVTLSGKPENASKLFTSASNLMIVKFNTDASVEKTGFRASWKIEPSSCGGQLSATNTPQIFTSPRYPETYPGGLECQYTITAPQGKIITIQLVEFDMEPENDFLLIRDGLSTTDPQLAKLTGTLDANPGFIMSTSNKMYLYIKTDFGDNRKGFQLKFVAGCMVDVESPSGVIYSPAHGITTYPNNLDCLYNLWNPKGSSFSLKFDDFDLEKSDFIQVYDGQVNGGVQLSTEAGFTGQSRPNIVLTAASGKMTLRFRSDPLRTGRGFTATFSADCPPLKVGKGALSTVRDHFFGTVVTYSCPTGQEFNTGLNRITTVCLMGGKWNVSYIPDCQERYCGPVPQINNGFAVAATNVTYRGLVTYQCYAGFMFRSSLETEVIRCTDAGRWEELPVCVTSECPPLEPVANAIDKVLHGGGRSYGTIVRFECQDGFFRSGLPVIACMSNGSWSGPPPVCIKTRCFSVPDVNNGFVADSSKEYLFGDQALVQCFRGYKLKGNKTITCGQNKTFQGLPVCEDVNECNMQTCDKASTDCTNLPGAFFCKCKDGFKPNLDCKPIGDLGLTTGAIPDGNIYASGVESGYNKEGIRFNSKKAWCGDNLKAKENWIMIDLLAPTVIHGFKLQTVKRSDGSSALPAVLRIQHTNDLTDVFRDYTTPNGEKSDFRTDATVGGKVQIFELPVPIEARYVRFVVLEYTVAPCMQLELMGCARQDCQDVNECLTHNGGCDQRCTNSPGSFACSCPNGNELYIVNGTAGYVIPPAETGLREGDVYRINKTCVRKLCPEIKSPQNGLLLSTETSFHFGDLVRFQCDFGYVMEGSPSLICTANGVWNSTVPVCKYARCDILKSDPEDGVKFIVAGNSTGSTIPYMQNVTIECTSHGHQLARATTANIRQCVYSPFPFHKNYWLSGIAPSCPSIICEDPVPSLGSVYPPLKFPEERQYGTSFNFECEDKFHKAGQSRSGDHLVRCMEDGIWDFGDLKCEGPVCQDPGHPPDGTQIATNYEQGSTVSFKCDRNGYIPMFDRSIQCIKDPHCAVTKPIGITSGIIPDSAITASEERVGFEAKNIRLNSPTGWCGTQDPLTLISLDLGKNYNVKAILLKGVVTNELVGRASEIRFFYKVKESDNYVSYYPNFNVSTQDPESYGELALVTLPLTVTARYISLGVAAYNRNPCMKFELLGCETPDEPGFLGFDMSYPACVDSQLPQFLNCPSEPIFINKTENGLEPAMFAEPVATDNSGRIARMEVFPQGFKPPISLFRDTVVEYYAYDFDGNVIICDVTIVIPDDTPPAISCPQSFVVEVVERQDYREVVFNTSSNQPIVFDRSNVTDVTYNPVAANISIGSYQNVTVTATDKFGNKASCHFQVFVEAAPCALWALAPPANGNLTCLAGTQGVPPSCIATCTDGYRFVDGEVVKNFQCNGKDDWVPSNVVPDCVPALGHQAAYDVVPRVSYRPFGAIPQECQNIYRDQLSLNYETLSKVLSQQCSSINVDTRVTFHNTSINISSTEVIIDFVLRVDPAVKQPLIYEHCGSTVGLIFDLNVPGTNVIVEQLLNVSGGGQCPGIQAKKSSISRGFTCNVGEILNKSANGLNSQCLSCPAGTFSTTNQNNCKVCPLGYYQDQPRQGECQQCPLLTYTKFEGSKSIADCLPVCGWGTFSPNGTLPCLQCPLDEYSGEPPVDGFKKCLKCPDKTFTFQPGAQHIRECRAQCSKGHYSPTGYEPCFACPMHFYQPGEGQVECSECSADEMTLQKASTSPTQCVPVECGQNFCKNDGQCVPLFHQPQCLCAAGFSGANCEQDIDECASNPCYNGAKCIDEKQAYRCQCLDGYDGLNCELEKDECLGITCPTNAMCQDLPGIGFYNCLCRSGYTGSSCNVTVNPCTTDANKCENGANCVPLQQGRYKCECPLGWEGQYCEYDIDDCEHEPCALDAKCTDLVHDFSCDCPHGFTGKRCEIKVDLCKVNPCAHGICADRIFFAECICKSGWSGQNCDVNLNECSSQPCSNHSTCIDLEDGYICQCESGFTGSRCQHRVDFCSSEPCQNGGTCQNGLEGFTCECRPGFVGLQCEIATDECSSNPCNAVGTERCIDEDSSFKCNCLSGFTGQLCDTNIDDCASSPCLNGGICRDGLASFTCQCPTGWKGQYCEQDVSTCVSKPCLNNANCIDLFQDYFCACPSGTDGKRCQTAPQRCVGSPCLNGGICQDFGSGLNCTCLPDFSGVGCEYDFDACAAGLCKNGATCERDSNNYKCICPPGYTGKNCEQAVQTCNPTSCPPTAKCIDLPIGFKCKCPFNSTGEDCRKTVNIDYDLIVNSRTRISFASLDFPFTMGSTSLTVALWVQFISSDDSGPFLTLYSVSSPILPLEKKPLLQIQGNGVKVTFFPDDPEVFIPYVNTITVTDGQWHHLAVVWDGAQATVTLVVDAVLVGTFPDYAIKKRLPAYGYVTLGSPFNSDEQGARPRDHGFHGYLSRVNIWNRALDVSSEIPVQVRNCKNSPELFNGLIQRWSGYDIVKGNIEKLSPGTCGQRSCRPGFSGSSCESLQEDKEAPTISSCPNHIWATAKNGSAIVEWPLPQFADNVNVTSIRENNNYAPGQVFLWGTYPIAYVASDAAGNLAVCKFTIYVRSEFCPNPSDPLGGTQRCSTWGPNSRYKVCTIQCQEESEFSQPVPNFYTCGPEGFWRPTPGEVGSPLIYPACSRAQAAQRIFRMSLNFPSSLLCSQSGTKIIENKVKEGITRLNRDWRVCSGTQAPTGTCSNLVVKVRCSRQEQRSRRQADGSETYVVEMSFPAVSDPAVNINTNKKSTVKNLVDNLVFESGAFDVRDALPNVVADPTSLATSDDFTCPVGKVVFPPKCVDCAPGTHYDSNTKSCILCALGSYQNDYAQTKCKLCPSIAGKPGSTSVLGARSADSCKERCGPGKYYDEVAGLCRSCGHGFYQPEEGKFSCLPCNFGLTTRTAEAISVNECREDCNSGQEIGLSGNCEPCRTGFYRSKTKSIACVPCPEETTTMDSGSTSMSDCVIPKCQPGTHLNVGSRTCLPCPKGTYQNESLQLECVQCVNKTTTLGTGSTSHEQCVNPCDLAEKNKIQCNVNAQCEFTEGMEGNICICNPGFTGNGINCTYMCNNYCTNDGVCSINKNGEPYCDCKGYFYGQHCEDKSDIAYIAGGIAGSVGLIIVLVLLICMICYRVNKKKEPKKPVTPTSDQQSQINFYYGAPAPYAESIAPSHHSTYAHYYDDDDDGWEMPNFYNETYMKEGLHNGKQSSNASLYGNKEDLYDRLRRHAYQGKKGDSDSDDQAH